MAMPIVGTANADNLSNTDPYSRGDTIQGLAGNDTLTAGSSGSDVLEGGTGDDRLIGPATASYEHAAGASASACGWQARKAWAAARGSTP